MKDQPDNITKLIADHDQHAKLIAQTLPPMLWSLFAGLRAEGFTDDQALRLVVAYLDSFYGGRK